MFVPTNFGDKHETSRLFHVAFWFFPLYPPPWKEQKYGKNPCKKAKKASKTVKKTGLKRAKRPGGGQQSFSFRLCLVQKCLGLGVPRFGGEPRSIVRGIFCAPVWREHKVLGPPILKDKNLITRIV